MRAAKLEGFDFHELRHYYASLLIRYGESIKTVQARLGHKSAEETLLEPEGWARDIGV